MEKQIDEVIIRNESFTRTYELGKEDIKIQKVDYTREDDEIPDGGYGWIISFCVFIVSAIVFGIGLSWGVFQDYYTVIMPNASTVDLDLVGTLNSIFFDGAALIWQILLSYLGPKIVLCCGTIILSLGLFLAGEATKVWHLYLTQGVLFGIGGSAMYIVVINVIPQWFNKRRGLALGLGASGTGIGGIIVPLLIPLLVENFGIQWCYRVHGFIALFFGILATILVKEHLPQKRGSKKLSQIIDLKLLKDFNYLLWCISADFCLSGYFIPFFYIPLEATSQGINLRKSSTIISILSAFGIIGRIFIGYMSDRIGRLNANIFSQLIAGISCIVIWPFAHSYSIYITYAVFYGLTYGSYFALMAPITVSIVGIERIGSGISLLFLLNIPAIIGPTIAGAIQNVVDPTSYMAIKVFATVVIGVGVFGMTLLKYRLTGSLWSKI